MIQILEENKRPSFGQRLSAGVGRGLDTATEMMKEYQKTQKEKAHSEQTSKLAKELGIEATGNPQLDQALLVEALKGKNQQELQGLKLQGKTDKNQENLAPLQAGLETINEMREIGKGNNLGRGSSLMGFFGGQTAKDRAKYSQLGKSLIQLATNIPIRNRQEFETLAHDLYDPSLPDDTREGILEAMESIIKGNMAQYQKGEPSTSANKPPLSSFHR